MLQPPDLLIFKRKINMKRYVNFKKYEFGFAESASTGKPLANFAVSHHGRLHTLVISKTAK